VDAPRGVGQRARGARVVVVVPGVGDDCGDGGLALQAAFQRELLDVDPSEISTGLAEVDDL
jgi:hypothetical protein